MDNIWLTIEEASTATGKAVHTLRKTIKKPNILTKYTNNRLMIEESSILKHYGMDKITNNTDKSNNQISHGGLIEELSSLIKENQRINIEWSKERSELGNTLIRVERSKDQEILKINNEKNKEILEKEKEILKIARRGDFFILISLVTSIFLTLAVTYIYIIS